MKREQAVALLDEYVQNQNLVRHMLAVEAAMEDYAIRFGEEPADWMLAGLLHDFDWEIHPTLEEHPQEGAPILRERALFACDEITGLLTAVALVRPSKSILDVKTKSIRKKWKDARFAANVNREDIAQGAEALGVELWEHIGNVLDSMVRIAPALGLEGETGLIPE